MRTPRPTLLAAAALAALATTACQDHPAAPAAPETLTAEARTVSGIAPFTLGYLTRAHPASPCQAPPYREFDFWLGGWNVESLEGAPVGTNLVRTRADGCIVEENWVAAGGNPGRSINTYDAETGLWGQTWVSAFAGGHLRMYGGLDDEGRMVLEGERVQPDGIEWLDRYVWTRLDGGRVLQEGSVFIPAWNAGGQFQGVYVPTDDFQPIPATPGTSCQAQGISSESRRFDYFAGDWTVEAPGGRAVASSEVSVDLGGCLFEEVFTTDKGYEAVAYTYYMWREDIWYRTWIDSEGERLELSGGFDGERLVLTGSEAGNGASGQELDARMTWTSMPDGSVQVTHETSHDGGDTWRQDLVLVYRGS